MAILFILMPIYICNSINILYPATILMPSSKPFERSRNFTVVYVYNVPKIY